MSFKSHAVLSRMKSCAIPCCPIQKVNHPFVQCIHLICTQQLRWEEAYVDSGFQVSTRVLEYILHKWWPVTVLT